MKFKWFDRSIQLKFGPNFPKFPKFAHFGGLRIFFLLLNPKTSALPRINHNLLGCVVAHLIPEQCDHHRQSHHNALFGSHLTVPVSKPSANSWWKNWCLPERRIMEWGEMALPLAALEDRDLDPTGHSTKSRTAPTHRSRSKVLLPCQLPIHNGHLD